MTRMFIPTSRSHRADAEEAGMRLDATEAERWAVGPTTAREWFHPGNNRGDYFARSRRDSSRNASPTARGFSIHGKWPASGTSQVRTFGVPYLGSSQPR